MTKRIILVVAAVALAAVVGLRSRELIRGTMEGTTEIVLAPAVPPPLPAPTPIPLSEAPLAEVLEEAKAPFDGDSSGRLLERRLDHGAAAGTVNQYLLYLPPDFERHDKRWPVILYLHGRSLRGDDLAMLRRYGLPRYLAEGRDLPFIVVAPQLPEGQNWTDVDRLATLLAHILARYPADRTRVYLTGYSMGGGGVWRMARAYGDMFAAAAPLAALTPSHSADWSRALSGLPLRVYHGTADEAAPFAGAEAMVAALRRDGLDVELRSYPGADHGDLTRVYADSSLYDWFLTRRRGVDL